MIMPILFRKINEHKYCLANRGSSIKKKTNLKEVIFKNYPSFRTVPQGLPQSISARFELHALVVTRNDDLATSWGSFLFIAPGNAPSHASGGWGEDGGGGE